MNGRTSGTAIGSWTGREAKVLRQALRLSVRAFAEHLGVAPRTVSKWEHLGEATRPYPAQQAILDTALERAGAGAQERFVLLQNRLSPSISRLGQAGESLDYESCADDLERGVIALSRQDFEAAARLLDRWLTRFPEAGLDDAGLYLHARTMMLLGDWRRDRGQLRGASSAGDAYEAAMSMFAQLDKPRRVAQAELSLTVVQEMTGQLRPAARNYLRLGGDERLDARDRARARLWIGTALSKDGQHAQAARVMTVAARELEDLGEAEDWSVAQQKLALAYRGCGDLSRAQHLIAVARSSGSGETPLQKIRLSTAQAHILLTDPGTRAEGLKLLDSTAGMAATCGLSHQLTTIESIRRHAS